MQPSRRKPTGGDSVRHDIKRFPRRLTEQLTRELLLFQMKTGVGVTLQKAFVRGVELALEELRRAPKDILVQVYKDKEL